MMRFECGAATLPCSYMIRNCRVQLFDAAEVHDDADEANPSDHEARSLLVEFHDAPSHRQ